MLLHCCEQGGCAGYQLPSSPTPPLAPSCPQAHLTSTYAACPVCTSSLAALTSTLPNMAAWVTPDILKRSEAAAWKGRGAGADARLLRGAALRCARLQAGLWGERGNARIQRSRQ